MNELQTVNDIDVMMKWANTLSESGIVPDAYKGKPANVIVALQMGKELGLQYMQSLNNVVVISGKPTLTADVKVGICMTQKSFVSIEYDTDDNHCTVIITRKINDKEIKFKETFSLENAKVAGLLAKDNWKKYPVKMMEARAKSACATKAFPDVLSGFYTKDEIETEYDYQEVKEPTIDEAIKEASETFEKNNNIEETVYTVVDTTKKDFKLSDEQKSTLNAQQIKFIEKKMTDLWNKDMTKYESNTFDDFVKSLIPKDYCDYHYPDLVRLANLIKLIDKDQDIPSEMLIELDTEYKHLRIEA